MYELKVPRSLRWSGEQFDAIASLNSAMGETTLVYLDLSNWSERTGMVKVSTHKRCLFCPMAIAERPMLPGAKAIAGII